MDSLTLGVLLAPLAFAGDPPSDPPNEPASYGAHCAGCHGAERVGGTAPPLIGEVLGRKTDERLAQVIRAGLPGTQMPAFGDRLDEGEVSGLVSWIRRPAGTVVWGAEEISRSRESLIPDGPALAPDVARDNLTLVVERGTRSIAVLDGDRRVEIDRFEAGRVHGGPKLDAALSRVWAVTRDGVVVAYDIDRGGLTARARVGVNTRNIAVDAAGERVAVSAQLPPQLVLLSGDLQPLGVIPLEGQPSGVYPVPGRDRFVLTLRDRPELIEVDPGSLQIETRALPEPFEDFVFVPGGRRLLASSRRGSQVHLYDLDSGQVLASLETAALPHLSSACFFERDGALHAALNHIGEARLTVVTVDDLTVQAEIPLVGAGYFARTHPGTPYIWIDTHSERIQLVSKDTLALVEPGLVPEPGKQAMHTEFSADGEIAWVSVWDMDGAVVIYDAVTLRELSRLPFAMPIGKYNATNKTELFRSAAPPSAEE